MQAEVYILICTLIRLMTVKPTPFFAFPAILMTPAILITGKKTSTEIPLTNAMTNILAAGNKN